MPEPLEKLQVLYEGWGRGDFSHSRDLFDPEMTMEGFGLGEPIRAESFDEFVEAMREWLAAWSRPLTVEAEEFIEAGDRILVLIHWSGKGRESGAQIDSRGAHLWTFRNGRVVRYEVYRDRDEARAALEAG